MSWANSVSQSFKKEATIEATKKLAEIQKLMQEYNVKDDIRDPNDKCITDYLNCLCKPTEFKKLYNDLVTFKASTRVLPSIPEEGEEEDGTASLSASSVFAPQTWPPRDTQHSTDSFTANR